MCKVPKPMPIHIRGFAQMWYIVIERKRDGFKSNVSWIWRIKSVERRKCEFDMQSFRKRKWFSVKLFSEWWIILQIWWSITKWRTRWGKIEPFERTFVPFEKWNNFNTHLFQGRNYPPSTHSAGWTSFIENNFPVDLSTINSEKYTWILTFT